jgi:hopene-associated glycosyltransferase HpnB
MTAPLVIVVVSLGAWVYLLGFRGGFWRARQRDDLGEPAEPAAWPGVVAVVPARDEADVVAQAIGSLRRQDYPGPFRIIVVDDNSDDGTAEAARAAEGTHPLEVIAGAPLADGWAGKPWAQSQGVAHAAASAPDYILFTDADISHERTNLRRLVARAEAGELALTSLMAELMVRGGWERLLIPAFVFFFQMLFPFAWVNDPARPTAAAAGGCMLIRREALERAGGLAAIRDKIIDDCALARLVKRHGPIWLGLTRRAHSLRPYARLGDIARMVSRSAYAQLDFSPWLLAGVLIGLTVVFVVPPLLWLFPGRAQPFSLLAWVAMAVAMQPTLRVYRLWGVWSLTLPFAAALYGAFTLWSAIEHWRGRGGLWKGRLQGSLAGRRHE